MQQPELVETERGLLGAMLLDQTCIEEAKELGLKPGEFSRGSHQEIYRQMMALAERPEATIDLQTLRDRLTASNSLERIGGVSYLASLIDGVPRRDSIRYYVDEVRRVARYRQFAAACSNALNILGEGPPDDERLERAQSLVGQTLESIQPNGFRSITQLCYDYLEDLEKRIGQNRAIGIPTGFDDFDERTFGLQRGELTVIAGRPSSGKTTWAMNMARNGAMDGLIVGVESLEMSGTSLGEKMLSMTAEIDSYQLRGGYLSNERWKKLAESLKRLEIPLFVSDDCSLTASQIHGQVSRLKRTEGLDVVVVDFLQLMAAPRDRMTRYEVVSENVRAMKQLARQLNVAVVLLSQLNREVEKRSDPEPTLADLRESGEIEQVADVVAFIYREAESETTAKIKIGKNRNGPAGGVFELQYDRKLNLLRNLRHY